ncbi:MAG: MgtC/SapB family protein [Bacilli bacterium]|jgi:putative Mg2+ transporter-C (MgtC) family protein
MLFSAPSAMTSTIDQYLIDWLNGLGAFGNILLIILSLFLAAIFSGAIGYEREYHGHSAGLRTHILVGVGSALIMIISIYGFGSTYPNRDPARLAAQVVSGIGFIGAGTIIQTGTDIKGLTTATTLWLTMAIGLAAGSGRFVIALVTTAIALITLIILRRVEHYASRKSPKITLVVPTETPILKQIHFVASRLGVSVKDFQSQIVNVSGQVFLRVSLRIAYMSTATSAALVEELKTTINPIEIRISTEY